MDNAKKIWFVFALFVLLLIGIFVVRAAIENAQDSTEQPQQLQPRCGPANCNQECGGRCNIPNCGCGG